MPQTHQEPWIVAQPLEGHGLRLLPYTDEDAALVFATLSEDTLRYYPWGPEPWSAEGFREVFRHQIDHSGYMPFVVWLGDEVVGTSSYMDIRPSNRGVEIGSTWIAPAHRNTWINSAMKLVMMSHAFEEKEAIRVCFKTDARNQLSRTALGKIGAKEEATLRNHVIMRDGYYRDTVYYSVLPNEWPGVKQHLIDRINRLRSDR